MDVFEKFAIFQGLAPDEAVAVRKISQEVKVAKGEIVFNEGDTGNVAFLLMVGQVEVRKWIGKTERTLATLGAGTTVGEMSLLNNAPRTATVVAVDAARLLKVSRAAFHELASAHPEIAAKVYANMARMLADRLRALDEEVARSASAPKVEELTKLLTKSL